MTSRRRDELLVSPGRLVAALGLIAFLAFFLPPYLARRLQQARISRATEQIQDLARALAAAGDALFTDPTAQTVSVLSGTGDPIRGAADPRWIAASAPLHWPSPSHRSAVEADPWLRALQINVGARRLGARVWVLSAGPNGLIERTFDPAPNARPGGDDIAVLLP